MNLYNGKSSNKLSLLFMFLIQVKGFYQSCFIPVFDILNSGDQNILIKNFLMSNQAKSNLIYQSSTIG